ncbi:MAG: ferritin family protein [Candidatus Zixiibacteriota bacterium]
MKLKTVEQILDFAIEKEQDASDFYTGLAQKMKKQHMKKVFEGFAKEEQGHKKKLQNVKAGKYAMPAKQKVQNLKIGDHLVEVELKADIEFQDALILAMKAEKAAFKLYHELAEACDDDKAKKLFMSLAQEEAKHKLRFEIEYDDYTYSEN